MPTSQGNISDRLSQPSVSEAAVRATNAELPLMTIEARKAIMAGRGRHLGIGSRFNAIAITPTTKPENPKTNATTVNTRRPLLPPAVPEIPDALTPPKEATTPMAAIITARTKNVKLLNE